MPQLDDIDLADLDRFTAGFPFGVFDDLRRDAPVWWHPPTAHTPGGEGFWVLSRYADIVAAAADDATFSSETGGDREGGGTTLEDMPMEFAVGALLNMMDDPRHAQFRRLLTPSTTPRALRAIELQVKSGIQHVRTHVDVSDPTLKGMEALLEVKEEVKP